MPYTLTPGNAGALAEREYAIAPGIAFTGFSSCIGVIARTNQSLLGIHLVLVVDDLFSTGDAIDVASRVQQSAPLAQEIVICGVSDTWRYSATGAYGALLERLRVRCNNIREDPDRGDGQYSASIVNGRISIGFH